MEVKDDKLIFTKASPKMQFQYKEIDAKGGDLCAIEMQDLDISEKNLGEHLDRNCCLEVENLNDQTLTICIIPDNVNNECEDEA